MRSGRETELRAADPGQSAALSTLETCPVFFWVITSEQSYSWVSVKMLINLEVTSDAEENALGARALLRALQSSLCQRITVDLV